VFLQEGLEGELSAAACALEVLQGKVAELQGTVQATQVGADRQLRLH
jgi:hypothetical protein